MKKKLPYLYLIVLVVGMLLFGTEVKAQSESQYTQYMYNTMSVNPAYAGSRGSLSILGLYRNQWAGLDGAPETLDFAAHSPIGIQGVGVGFAFNSDKIGPSKESEAAGTVSYTIQLNQKGTKLAFGLRAGLNFMDVDPNKLTIYDPNDYDLTLEHFSSPIFGAGFFLYDDNWYVGLSTPNLLKTRYYDEVQVSTASSQAHYYLTGGYIFDISSNLKLKPATMIKATTGAPVSVDVSLNALLINRITLGAAYRWNAAWGGLAGFQITDRVMVGYAYDFHTRDLRHYHNNSHEVFLRFELGTRLKPKVNPRFF